MATTREELLKLAVWILLFVNILQFLYNRVKIPENIFNTSLIFQNYENGSFNDVPIINDDILIIHQIWIGEKHPPIQLMRDWNIKHKKYCPNSDYILWSDMKNLDNIKNISLWDIRKPSKLFENIKNNSYNIKNNNLLYNMTLIYDMEITLFGKADILRLIVLYIFGGIYIDADSAWINDINYDKCLNTLFNKFKNGSSIFAALEPQRNWPANGVIGVKGKENILIKELLIDLTINYTKLRIIQDLPPWKVMGPLLLQRHENNMTIFPSQYFYPMKWFAINKEIDLRNQNTTIHFHRNFSNTTYMFQYGLSTNAHKGNIQWRRRG